MCCTAEKRYRGHITPSHSQMGKSKPEAIVKVTRNKYQQDKGPAGCSNVVIIYFKKPSPADDTAMQSSSASTCHQTKTHQVTKPSAELRVTGQRMRYMETNFQLLHKVVLNINT